MSTSESEPSRNVHARRSRPLHRRRSRPGAEALETRRLLAGGLDGFAQIQGVLGSSAEVHPIRVEAGMFAGRGGRVLVEFDVVEVGDGEGAFLAGVTRQAGPHHVGSAILRRLSTDQAVASLRSGSFTVGVAPDPSAGIAAASNGSGLLYTVDVELLGDVNGDFVVNQADLRRIYDLRGSRAGDDRFDATADVTRDGRIDGRDYLWTQANLGARTTIRPLEHQADVPSGSDPNGDNVVSADAITIEGATIPGAVVEVDRGNDGTIDGSVQADDQGRYVVPLALQVGSNPVQFAASDVFGQRALRSVDVVRSIQAPQGGVIVQAPDPLRDFYQAFDGANKVTSTIGGTSFVVENLIYAVPGTDVLNAGTPGINAPLTPNGGTSFNQPVQSNDWWSNLMLPMVPTTQTDPLDPSFVVQLGYANAELWSEPAGVRIENGALGTLNPLRGISIFSPTTLFEDLVTDPASTLPWPVLSAPAYTPAVSVVVDGLEPITIDSLGRQQLLARVNSYSDWGVEIGYNNASDSMTVDMLNGSPFTYFTKTGPAALKVAVQGSTPDAAKTVVSTFDTGDPEILGVRLIHHVSSATVGDNQKDQISHYLIMTKTQTAGAGWSVFNTDNRTYTIYTNPIGDAQIVVATLPAEVNGQDFDTLSDADKQAVAQYFKTYAFNVPTSTQVSDPTAAYNAATGTVTSTLTVTTDTGGPMLQVVYPHQWRNLIAADQANLGQVVPGLSTGSAPVEMTWPTPRGTAKLYAGNALTTSLDYQPILPYLPPVGLSDPATALTLYQQLAGWYQYRFNQSIDNPQTPNLASFAGPLLNTYALEFRQITDTIRLADQLASDLSPLDAAKKQNLVRVRDWFLDSARSLITTYFDIATGKLMQLNQTFDTVIGYPAGFGSEINLNDHHFHYGYFLDAFAALAAYDPEFVQSYQASIAWLVADVANTDRTRTDVPFLRNFSPWAGHSYADGLGRGGNNQESSSEAMQFSASLIQLGEFFNRADWRNLGVYLHTTEAEAIHNYWLNSYAYDAQGNFVADDSNWPEAYARAAGQDPVTQIAVVRQNLTSQATLFGGKIDARYAINWVPADATSFYLVRDTAYAGVNWSQFAADYTKDNLANQGGYELATAVYQSMIAPGGGSGPLAPGSAGALARIAAFPAANGNRYEDGYLGTSVPIAGAFAGNLGALGAYDPTVTANTPYYAVFQGTNGVRTYVVYVPANAINPTTSVTFRDASGNVVATKPITGTGLFTFVGDSTTPRIDTITPPARITQGALYLTSDPNGGSLALGRQPGTSLPNNSQTYAVPSLTPYSQPGQLATFVNVPARDPSADGNSNARPADASRVLAFDSGPVTAKFNAGVNNGQTLLELFFNQYLEPGIIQNLKVSGHNMVVRVLYNPTDGTGPNADRVEEYTVILDNNNRYVVVNENSSVVPVSITGAFPQTLNRLRIEVWGGAYPADSAYIPYTNRPVALSVNTPVPLGRSSRIGVPYTFAG